MVKPPPIRSNLYSPSYKLFNSLSNSLSFFFLVGFVASQGYLVPIFPLSVNWAVWPSLPDLFGLGLVATVILFFRARKISQFHQDTLRDLVKIGFFLLFNFVIVTIPSSTTGEGIKYGGFSLILFAKYLIVYWAASHITLNRRRIQVLHCAALFAFIWLFSTTLADRFSIIEVDNYARHLPSGSSGKWDVTILRLDSTVSATHGGTTVVILVLSALVIGTAKHRLAWAVEILIFSTSLFISFISGSRQGLVRITSFIILYVSYKRLVLLIIFSCIIFPIIYLGIDWESLELFNDNPYYIRAVNRQSVLASDPFSTEGLSGRPELWLSVIDVLDAEPLRWLTGYGIGNFVEHDNAAHNMILKLIQDGGIIHLFIVGGLWLRIFYRVWLIRRESWAALALTIGMLTSTLTSDIFSPNLSTGWYLGLYFVTMTIIVPYEANTLKKQRGNRSINMKHYHSKPDHLGVTSEN